MTQTQSEGATPPGTPDWAEPETLPLQEVRDLFGVLSKALRARQLYDENNPVYQRFVSGLRNAFRGLWESMDRLHVGVEEDRFTWMGEEVYRETNRTDSLAFLAYKDGVRDLSFLPGMEDEELDRFMDVLQRARYLRSQGEDLLTLLWDEDLERIRYSYVDFLAEPIQGVAIPEPDEDSLRRALEGELKGLGSGGDPAADPEDKEGDETTTAAVGEAAPDKPEGVVNQEDFNPTLYSLDPKEMTTIQEELRMEEDRDLRGAVLNALLDRLEEPGYPDRQEEIISVLRTLLPNLLSRGAVVDAARVLDELGTVLAKRSPQFTDATRERGERIFKEISSPEALQELVRSLQDGTLRPHPEALANLLKHFQAGAMAPLLSAMENTTDAGLREVIGGAVGAIAKAHRGEVTQLLTSDELDVRLGALRLVGSLGLAEAAPAVAKMFSDPNPALRRVAVETAGELRSATVMGALQQVLSDPQPEIRVAAARVLGEAGYRPAAAAFREIVQGKEIRAAELSEKIAVFEAYGRLGDPQAVGVLGGILNSRGFLGRREPSEVRACAALGLGKVGDDAAVRELEKASRDDDPVVRNAVSRALREGE
ncbi:MAG: HEAT repeat domain-containing protein [Gemmatimonadota bacterium]